MKWIPCSERLPPLNQDKTSLRGGTSSDRVMALFESKTGWRWVSVCVVVYYDHINEDGSPGTNPVWADIEEDGALDYCESHGGSAPIAWLPMPEGP